MRQTQTGTIIFAVHVDDIISIASTPAENNAFHDLLKSKWDISKLGPVKYALGISVECDLTSHTISLSQTSFIDRIVSHFNQTDAHPCDTPMVAVLRGSENRFVSIT